jgi:hypothetical protein
MKMSGTMVLPTGREDYATVSMGCPTTDRQRDANLLLPPSITGVHLGVDVAIVVVDWALGRVCESSVVCGLAQKPPGAGQDIPAVEDDGLRMRVGPLPVRGLAGLQLMAETILRLVNAPLDVVDGAHSVVDTEYWQHSLEQVVYCHL